MQAGCNKGYDWLSFTRVFSSSESALRIHPDSPMSHIYIISTALVLGAMHRCNRQTVETEDINPTTTPKGSTEETEVPADGHASGAHDYDGAALYSRYCACLLYTSPSPRDS